LFIKVSESVVIRCLGSVETKKYVWEKNGLRNSERKLYNLTRQLQFTRSVCLVFEMGKG